MLKMQKALVCGLLLMVVLEQAESAKPVCPHGPAYIDECENECICDTTAGGYGCTRRGCTGHRQAEIPMQCEADDEIRVESSRRLFCEGNVVRFEPSRRQFCAGAPLCPAECDQQWDRAGSCYNCTCGPALLQFGDVTVAAEEPCPPGLVGVPSTLSLKVCKGWGCQRGVAWTDSRGCSTCVCAKFAEPACTPCKREASESTRTCEHGLPACPADCTQAYDPEEDCYQCSCGVGEEGDVVVQLDQPCPPGTDLRTTGALLKACAPFRKLPRGDSRFCGEEFRKECPADCGLVRVGENEGCLFCQCGPEYQPIDLEVGTEEECPWNLVEGPATLTTKVCRQPTRHSCKPGTKFNEKCDICLCQEDGTAACTKRDCTLPRYGDYQECRRDPLILLTTQQFPCPPDCGQAGFDAYCIYCQCGLRREPGEFVVARHEPCPSGFRVGTNNGLLQLCLPRFVASDSGCPYGKRYITECGNTCQCIAGSYACTYRGCSRGQTPGKPLTCTGPGHLPKWSKGRVVCHEGIVKVQSWDEPCLEGSTFMDEEDCNDCFCTNGLSACTLMACVIDVRPGK